MSYNIQEQEKKRQDFWFEHQIYAFDKENKDNKPVYSIDTPPPTVSGALHIGHVFSYTQGEFFARYKRMKGFNVFYPVGYDDNGIPTEILAEKELKISLKDTERQEFIHKCLDVTEKYRNIYENFWKSLGMSMDRSRAYSTISPRVQAISQQRFVELYQKNIINKKEFPALRCTKNQTTIAQAETEEEEFDEFFNDIKFTTDAGQDLVIATTRPELMPACVACFVHPDDTRYQKLIGKNATTPFGAIVPILADDKVKMDKGTGALMCCSYGDEMDVYWIMKYQITPKIILNRYGKIENSGVEELDGLKVKDAREKIIELLEVKGAILKRTAIKQSKAISERGKVPVEIIPVPQWFVDILDYKEQILTQNDKMHWHPEFMQKRSTDWVQNLQRNRNISRNRKFGIPLPVWYSKKTGEIILPDADQFPVDPVTDFPKTLPAGHSNEDVVGDSTVLDTWFTSGLTPTINQEFLKQDGCNINISPMDLRIQAHDIIRTRALYSSIQSMHHNGEVPFKNLMISGHVLAGKNEKISKSKGNAKFGPEQLLSQFGADVTRYWSLTGQLGKDIVFEEGTLKNGNKLLMKLRNAFNFLQMHLTDFDPKINPLDKGGVGRAGDLYPTDTWLLHQLNQLTTKMTDLLDRYEFGLAKIAFEEFFWQDFCDNYLEIVKLRLYKPELFKDGQQKRASAQYTLYHAYYTILGLIAPYMPHIAEELYQSYYRQHIGTLSIHQIAYPTVQKSEGKYTDTMELIKQIISEVRGYKTANQLSLGADLAELTITAPADQLTAIQSFDEDLRGVTKATTIVYQEGKELQIICK